MWTVYIAVTAKGNLYTGIAKDPVQRVYDHNYTKNGAACLIGQRPVALVWVGPTFDVKGGALKEEHRIKQLSRKEKIELVKSNCVVSVVALDVWLRLHG
jgi:putative endonuclease